jgi:hypothetical protein
MIFIMINPQVTLAKIKIMSRIAYFQCFMPSFCPKPLELTIYPLFKISHAS